MTGLLGAAPTTTDDGLFDSVNNFFDSEIWAVIWRLGLFFVAVFWLSTAFWVYKDARRRIDDRWLVVMATILGLVPPFVGALIYMLFRPPEYLDDVRERELEIKAIEERLQGRGHCPVCRAEVDASYLVCPVCTTKLKQACTGCRAPLEPLWQVCPYCETPVERRAPIDLSALGEADEDTLDPLEAPLRTPRRRRRRAE